MAVTSSASAACARGTTCLLAQGLVDKLHVVVGPGAIGSGVPTFTQPVEQDLTLLDVRRMEDSQLVTLRYAVSKAPRDR